MILKDELQKMIDRMTPSEDEILTITSRYNNRRVVCHKCGTDFVQKANEVICAKCAWRNKQKKG